MQMKIQCDACSGTGDADGVDEHGEFDACDLCHGEGALVRCSCGATVALRDAGSNGFCAQCPETVARRAAEAKLRAEGWDALGRVVGEAAKRIPGLRVELIPDEQKAARS